MKFSFADVRVENNRRFRKLAIVALLLFLIVIAAGLMQSTGYYDVRQLLSH